jgi:hypothetical protein
MPVSEVKKEDCLNIDEAKKQIGRTKQSLYNYMNMLGVQRYRFPYDRRTYIRKTDVERIEQFMKESKG